MQQIELPGEGLLDEIVNCMYVCLYLLAFFEQLVDLVKPFFFAGHAHLQLIVLFLQLHLTRR